MVALGSFVLVALVYESGRDNHGGALARIQIGDRYIAVVAFAYNLRDMSKRDSTLSGTFDVE